MGTELASETLAHDALAAFQPSDRMTQAVDNVAPGEIVDNLALPIDGVANAQPANGMAEAVHGIAAAQPADGITDTQAGTTLDADNPGADLIVLVLIIGVALISQFLLKRWQTRSPKSFHFVTLICLWLFPLTFAIYFMLWRLFTIMTVFTAISGYLLYQVKYSQPLPLFLPRWVYTWFSFVHRSCYLLALAGYIFIMLALFVGLPTGVLGFYLGLYGLYFGVLSRDLAEFTAENVVVKIGYYSGSNTIPNRTLSARICALCDQELDLANGSQSHLRILSCGHRYHDLCIRGWAMVGKKDTCPCCQEKIDLKHITSSSVWQNVSLHWCQILDAVRYMVVWNPIIFIVMQTVIHLTGFDHTHAV